MTSGLPRLHALTDRTIFARTDWRTRAAQLAAGAGRALALHVRDPSAGGYHLHHTAEAMAAIAAAHGALVFVAGRADLAASVGAAGLHLRQDDLPIAAARRVFRTGFIGRSVHSIEEAEAARAEGADYLLLGAVYETPSHPGRPALGLEVLRRVAALDLPVIAIGGIDRDRAREVRAAGAWGVAAIRACWDAEDPADAARALAGMLVGG